MSLNISVIFRDVDDKLQSLAWETLNRSDIFGFEVCRYRLWGAEVVKSLGLSLIPSLGDGDMIYAENEELDVLEHEARMILENSKLISQTTNYDVEFIESRILNLLSAIEQARTLATQYSRYGVWIA